MKETKVLNIHVKPELFECLSKMKEDTGIAISSLVVLAITDFIGKPQEGDWWKPWAKRVIDDRHLDD